jgi:hypothetical protein
MLLKSGLWFEKGVYYGIIQAPSQLLQWPRMGAGVLPVCCPDAEPERVMTVTARWRDGDKPGANFGMPLMK